MPNPKAEDPHSLTFDREGNIFFTTEESNFVGKLDPNSGKVTVKQVPTPHANPYGIIAGIGRLDPRSGKIEEWPSPGGRNSEPTVSLLRRMEPCGTANRE
jgi:streptogramin lyase